MPMAARYLTIDGEVLSEKRGAEKRDYLPDPLGSTAALLDSSQIKSDTFTYWPYGEVRTRTGSTPTPFQFVGTLGYYTDLGTDRVYVRARIYIPSLGRWLTADPLWPREDAYGYADLSAVSMIDPFGKKPQKRNGQKGRPSATKNARRARQQYFQCVFGCWCALDRGNPNPSWGPPPVGEASQWDVLTLLGDMFCPNISKWLSLDFILEATIGHGRCISDCYKVFVRKTGKNWLSQFPGDPLFACIDWKKLLKELGSCEGDPLNAKHIPYPLPSKYDTCKNR